MIAETPQAVHSLLETFWAMGQDIVLQEYVRESKGRDIRAIVVGGRVVASMRRVAKPGEFRSNLHRGGKGDAVDARRAATAAWPSARPRRWASRSPASTCSRGESGPEDPGDQQLARPRGHRARERRRRRRRDRPARRALRGEHRRISKKALDSASTRSSRTSACPGPTARARGAPRRERQPSSRSATRWCSPSTGPRRTTPSTRVAPALGDALRAASAGIRACAGSSSPAPGSHLHLRRRPQDARRAPHAAGRRRRGAAPDGRASCGDRGREVPVIAAVQGDVYGGGCELSAPLRSGDRREPRRRSPSATPRWASRPRGAATRLVERVGPIEAARLLFTAEKIDAAEALAHRARQRGGRARRLARAGARPRCAASPTTRAPRSPR